MDMQQGIEQCLYNMLADMAKNKVAINFILFFHSSSSDHTS